MGPRTSMDFRQTYRRSSALCPHRQLHCLESAARCGTQMAPRCELQADYRPGFYIQKATCRSHAPVEMSWIYPANPSYGGYLSSSFFVNVYQRVNLHFPMVFLWFSYGFPIKTSMFPWFSGWGSLISHRGHGKSQGTTHTVMGTQWLDPYTMGAMVK